MRTSSAEVEEGAGRWTPVDPSGRIQMLHRGSLTMDHEDIVCKGGGGCGDMNALLALHPQLRHHHLCIAWHLHSQPST